MTNEQNGGAAPSHVLQHPQAFKRKPHAVAANMKAEVVGGQILHDQQARTWRPVVYTSRPESVKRWLERQYPNERWSVEAMIYDENSTEFDFLRD